MTFLKDAWRLLKLFELEFELEGLLEMMLTLGLWRWWILWWVFYFGLILAFLDLLFQEWLVLHDGFESELKFLIFGFLKLYELIFRLKLDFKRLYFFFQIIGVQDFLFEFFISLLQFRLQEHEFLLGLFQMMQRLLHRVIWPVVIQCYRIVVL